MTLKERFRQNCLLFTRETDTIEKLWSEIEKRYTEKSRHYHNFAHLESMFAELDSVTARVEDMNSLSFSVFYHDVIYDASSKNNEEKSATFAVSQLAKINISSGAADKITRQIMATKSHQQSDDPDTNYLLDADLSILGKDPETYFEYTRKIRKEYSVYPDLLYKPGRKRVLKHFLDLEYIFKTEYFREKYELQARENIEVEIKS
ncbi:hypothetical protein ODZ84_20435 [Chryseobacterium fluminis]|uniref:HD domain-containing protein n=1 Tax=Chryseobacterium fluminis TaxID=2983606 RepID=UPI0022508445|nr:hypothetical protein [Chryseobacterium sp. MMS21-Ot14]UZT97518.1 hypothetical protein ODZ84_20435 [Chryseobacterium sp. MMS21-Ot14]